MAVERRLVAVLFADVVGSTALSDGMDPEDTRALMGRYFDHAKTVMENTGGRLEKFIGDAVVAVFGIPMAQGDEAERALKAACDLHEAVRRDPVLGGLLKLRIGVNLGEVVADTESTADHFIASGDAMNTAARLEQAAEPDEVLASDRVFLAAEDAFEFGEPRFVAMKGKGGPVRVHPVAGPRERRRITRPPIVGRRQDLLQFRLSAERVAEEERARLVTVLGPGGIGKTRLIEEFAATLPPEPAFEAVTVELSQSAQVGSAQVRSLLSGLLGAEVTADRIQRLLADGDYAGSQSATVVRDLMAALGDGGRIGEESGAMLAALRLVVSLAAGDRAVVVIVDDAHLASDLLLDLVEQMAALRSASRMLVIVAARPELLERRPNWGAGQYGHMSLILPPLSRSQTRALVEHYLVDQPNDFMESIAERAGGNPFFALEFVRAVASGAIVADAADGERALGSGLPDTVHAAVLARLDLLTPCARDVLRLASVCGTALPADSYPDLLPGWTAVAVAQGVEELLAQDILHMERGRRLTIRQSFVREVAYGTLSRAACLVLHGGVAGVLAGLDDGSETVEIVVGRHYLAIAEVSRRSAVPPVLPFDPADAVRSLTAAGIASSRAGLALDAEEFIEGALEFAPRSLHSDLLELLATITGVSPRAVHSLERALGEICEAELTEDQRRETAVRLRRKLLMLWLRCGLMSRLQVGRATVLDCYREAYRLAEAGISAEESMRLRSVDLFLFFDGAMAAVEGAAFVPRAEPAALVAAGQEIAEHFRTAGDVVAASEIFDGCQFAASALDLPELVLEVCARRAALPDLPAHEFGDALAMLARSHAILGDPLPGLAAIEQALSGPDRSGYAPHLAQPLGYALAIAYDWGEWDFAERLGTHLTRIYDDCLTSPQDKPFCFDGFFALTRIALARDDREAANRFARLTMDAIQDVPTLLPAGRAILSRELADLPGDDAGVAVLATQAFAVVAFNNERGVASAPDAIAAAGRNSAAYRSGVIEVALALRDGDAEALARCIGFLDGQGRAVAAARLRIVHCRLTGDRTQLAPARTVLEKLRDVRFLRRLDRVEARRPV